MPQVLVRINNILLDPGYVEIIVQDGKGINKKFSLLEVAGRKLQRTVYCYSKNNLTEMSEQAGLEYLREGYLNPTLLDYGWRSYIFKLRKNPSNHTIPFIKCCEKPF